MNRKWFPNTLARRVQAKALFAAAMLGCALAGAAAGGGPGDAAPAQAAAPELPRSWQGRPLWPLALSAVEQRFAERFPGHIQRATDGRQIVVLRSVTRPTRMLHPAADCYRGLGYRVEGERLEQAPAAMPAPDLLAEPALRHAALLQAPRDSGVQRCFTARRGGTALRVCEHIEDAAGRRFADTSAWYWAALTGRSQGPWQAVTVTRALAAAEAPI
ncbi:hypothetical protein [Ottowia sp.]|uniref:hypothetical protein n=1 Tax=Ottowia sp. TaxID=1898956 RepID=UPI002B841C77|nr:hypothetical protein [Ottowia sp.]MCP5259528.1 hypothetical protein [Burkholderiaceae bacterium]HRW73436.1 hypothetical protein [Ottowia sp.]